MRRTLATLALLPALLSTLFACDDPKSSGGAASSASASATATTPPSATASSTAAASATASASAAVPLPKCPAGLTGNGFPAYCIKLPATYKVKEARTSPKKGTIEYDTGNGVDNLTITFDETSVAELVKQTEGEMKFGGDKLDKKGDLPGGNKFFEGTHADYSRIVTLFKAAAPLSLKCSFAYKPKAAPPKEAIDACKSIVVPAP